MVLIEGNTQTPVTHSQKMQMDGVEEEEEEEEQRISEYNKHLAETKQRCL
jgi:hypothetical protein